MAYPIDMMMKIIAENLPHRNTAATGFHDKDEARKFMADLDLGPLDFIGPSRA